MLHSETNSSGEDRAVCWSRSRFLSASIASFVHASFLPHHFLFCLFHGVMNRHNFETKGEKKKKKIDTFSARHRRIYGSWRTSRSPSATPYSCSSNYSCARAPVALIALCVSPLPPVRGCRRIVTTFPMWVAPPADPWVGACFAAPFL